jgi:hypothetical protein
MFSFRNELRREAARRLYADWQTLTNFCFVNSGHHPPVTFGLQNMAGFYQEQGSAGAALELVLECKYDKFGAN